MQPEWRTPRGHVHAEAFCLMSYVCQNGHHDQLWNSRDGVTPFIIKCRWCGTEAHHVNWQDDLYAPDHVVAPGDRFFRDGTVEEAEENIRLRVLRYNDPIFQPTDEQIRAMATDPLGNYPPGWPKIDQVPRAGWRKREDERTD